MIIAFTLSMPSAPSWNGRWSGDGDLYVIIRSVRKPDPKVLGSHSYRWSDGWCARVEARQVDSREAHKLRRKSKGFCGYNWMVESILRFGQIQSPTPAQAEVGERARREGE